MLQSILQRKVSRMFCPNMASAQERRRSFLWEGVSYYLPENAVRATLHNVAAHSAPGSAIAVDFIERSLIDKLGKDLDPATPPVVRAGVVQAKRMAELGEPWMFGIPQGGGAAFLCTEGLEPREILPNNGLEATRRYRTRRDGTLVGSVPASELLTSNSRGSRRAQPR